MELCYPLHATYDTHGKRGVAIFYNSAAKLQNVLYMFVLICFYIGDLNFSTILVTVDYNVLELLFKS